jgi:hypothetical protein
MANYYVEGLLKQLHSEPLEIRVVNLCFESCPSLRDMQAELFNKFPCWGAADWTSTNRRKSIPCAASPDPSQPCSWSR